MFSLHGSDVLQYSNSEGYPELREYIAERYHQKENLDIPVEDILITSGSQQGLDLLGKIFLNDDDGVKDNVVFVPGDPFYVEKTRTRTLRLNFSCIDEETIRIGIQKLANTIKRLVEIMA